MHTSKRHSKIVFVLIIETHYLILEIGQRDDEKNLPLIKEIRNSLNARFSQF